MKLMSNEISLVGKWLLKDGQVVRDEVCARIEMLTQTCLRELGRDASGWDVLYLDPEDGRLWELIYRDSGLHGGGAPELRCLTKQQARDKYAEIPS